MIKNITNLIANILSTSTLDAHSGYINIVEHSTIIKMMR